MSDHDPAWLRQHDAQVAAKALREAARDAVSLYAYNSTSLITAAVPVANLLASADRIEQEAMLGLRGDDT